MLFNFTDITINESGVWNVTAVCTDGTSTGYGNMSWGIDFGTITVTRVTPTTDLTIVNGTADSGFSVNVSCNERECANVTVYLDPIIQDAK